MTITTSTEPTNVHAEEHSVITPETQDESLHQTSSVSITDEPSSDAAEETTEPQPLPSAVEESEAFSENKRLPLPTPSAPSQKNQACTPSTSPPIQTDERWLIKKILWPPFPPSGSNPKSISIIMQNTNGPCSLLAVCNILLLQGSIVLPGPPDRTSISFQTLSSVLADYLVRHSSDPTNLSTALSVIPSSRTGLDLNPRFGSIDGFGPGSGELALFSSAGVPLVHGWVADPQDQDTWDALMKCGDYDKAVEAVVVGEELLEKPQQGKVDRETTAEEKQAIHDACAIRRFLDASSTQLSFFGLFQLVSGLAPDSLTAFFRNSHLSVLYRRPIISPAPPAPLHPPLPPPPEQIDPDYSHETMLEVHAISQSLAQAELESHSQHTSNEDESGVPKLFSLVTDMSFLNERHIVWESLEDVEGGMSEFYDWNLTRSRLKAPPSRPSGQHVASGHSTRRAVPQQQITEPNQLNSDLLCAQQLQEEEYRNQESRAGLQSGRFSNPSQSSQQTPGHIQQLPPQPAPHPQVISETTGTPALRSQQGLMRSGSTHSRRVSHGSGQKKKNCIIM